MYNCCFDGMIDIEHAGIEFLLLDSQFHKLFDLHHFDDTFPQLILRI